MNSFKEFNEKKLPNKDNFYKILNDEHITDKKYEHAKNVFRNTCMQYCELDPCYYFTSRGLSWDPMLNMTNIKLELLTDIDMFQFIEKGMRGGVSYIANRYGKSNNKYMKNYDKKTLSKYITYLDANNLYGWAMSQYLPTGSFRWMTEKEISKINLAMYKEDSKKGLILEVDLECPQELHHLHNDYPLATEKNIGNERDAIPVL